MSDRRRTSSSKGSASSQHGKRRAPLSSSDDSSQRRSPPRNPAVPSSSPTQRRHPLQPPTSLPQSPESAFVTPPLPRQHRLPHQQQAGKIAIPRLPRDADSTPLNQTEKSRVSHACEPCRQRKTKCSGERPVCKHCEEFQINCYYADGKRDRTKKELGNMAGKIQDYEKLLRDLSFRTCEADQSLIRKVLQKEDFADADDAQSESSSRRSRGEVAVDGEVELAGEHRVTARVGSTGSLDNIEEDYNRSPSARATGFLGKNSEVVWMQRLNRWADATDSDEGSTSKNDEEEHTDTTHQPVDHESGHGGNEGHSTSDATYHCDDVPVIVTDQVDAFELPPKHIADQFFKSYLDTVHPAFPILGKSTFISQYQTFANRESVNTGNNWRAILNLIFAIAAKYSHLVQADWRGDERDHLIYFTRARMLGFNGESILAHPELQQIQIVGMMAFYLTAINQINRAWAVSGIAIRHAVTLGMNLQNDSKEVHRGSREIRYRVWWALCYTERMLAVMTGRPTSLTETDCSVPLPLPIDEEILFKDEKPIGTHSRPTLADTRLSRSSRSDFDQSPSSRSTSDRLSDGVESLGSQSDLQQATSTSPSDASCFLAITRLGVLTNEVMSRLYRAGVSNETWAQVQNKITDLNGKIDSWLRSLPPVLDFTKKQHDQQFLRHRLHLGFAYYSTRTIINRPALCRIDRKVSGESGRAREQDRIAAAKCVHSAQAVTEMFPNVPNPAYLYGVAPWWSLVHHLVQASTVLMLELSFRADHMPNEAEEILGAAKKVVLWLRSMSEENMAARRAWKMCDSMLRKVAPKIGRTVDDLPKAHSPLEPYEAAHFHSSASILSFPTMTTQPEQEAFYPDGQLEEQAFRPQIYTSYDEIVSSSMNAPSITAAQIGTLFPSAAQMDVLRAGDRGGSSANVEPRWNIGGNNG